MNAEQLIAELRRVADDLERSRRREAFDPLAAATRVAIADEVASVMRHDLRNKLGSIRNAAFYVRRRIEPTDLWQSDPRLPQFCALIDETVLEATRMLDDPLGPGRRPARQGARASARECVGLAASCVDVPPGVRLEVDPCDDTIAVDQREGALAVRCLLENAIEAVAQGGAVSVSAREEGVCISVTVTDDGPGVRPENLEKMFEPFYTTKEGHAGLGLNIARRIARRWGGELGVTSSPKGTAATLVLPRAAEADPGPEPEATVPR